MSVRCCCYKDCENVCIGQVSNGTFTLFQFPKDPVRRKQWMELGQVNPNIPANNLLMCSDHFDRTKFLSINPRRTILVGAAIPYAHSSLIKDDTNENIIDDITPAEIIETDDLDNVESGGYIYYEETNVQRNDEDEEQEFHINSTIENDDEDNILSYKELISTGEECADEKQEYQSEYTIASSVVTINPANKYKLTEAEKQQCLPSKKRKAIDEEPKLKIVNTQATTTTTSKHQKAIPKISTGKYKTNTPTVQDKSVKTTSALKYVASDIGNSIPDGNNALNCDIDESTLIDTDNVTSFIFKGEEFVQMSKEFFIKDKLALLQKIKQYETILRTIQHNVNSIDFDEHIE